MPSKQIKDINSKKIIAGLVSLAIISTSFGMIQKIEADEVPESTNVSQDEDIIIQEFEYIPNPDILPDEKELYQGYLDSVLYSTPYGVAGYGVFGESDDTPLNATELALYTGMKAAAEKIADGETDSSIISVPNLTDIDTLDFNLVMGMLLEDCPYSFYWFDKTVSSNVKLLTSVVTQKSTLQVHCSVSANYSVGGQLETTNVDTSKTAAAVKSKTNAQRVVRANAGKSDLEKLIAYRDYILEQTAYNYDALDPNVPYGDPWQMIHVFDGDPDTNVVCEGYTKAFQYLCDLTTFENDIFCMAASGTLISPSITGDHMWCVVSINDKSYLADLSNSDEGMAGHNGELFLTAPSSGSYASGYSFTINGKNISYVYNSDSKETYGEKYLTLADEDYIAEKKNISVEIDGIKENYSDLAEAVNAISASGSGGSITLLDDISYSGTRGLVLLESCDLNLNGYTLDMGTTNIVVSGSDLTITGTGTIKSNTTKPIFSADVLSSISIAKASVTNTGTGSAIEGGTVNIAGGTFTGKVVAELNSIISGGQFNGEVVLDDSAKIEGGTFKALVTIAGGFDKVHFSGGSFGVGMTSSQKSISSSSELSACLASSKAFYDNAGELIESDATAIYGPTSISNVIDYGAMYTSGSTIKKYETISQTIAAAPAGAVVSLIKDNSLSSNITISRNITLDLNGKTLNCGSYNITGTGKLLIKDTSASSNYSSTLNIKSSNITIDSGSYASITVTGATLADVLSTGKAFVNKTGQWVTSDTALSATSIQNVSVSKIPIESFSICEDIIHEVGSNEEIKLTANASGDNVKIEWYKDGSSVSLGSGDSYTVTEDLRVGEHKFVATASSNGYTISKSVIVTVSPHIIKANEIAFKEGSIFEKEYDGNDTCSTAAVVILPGIVENEEEIQISGTIKYNDINVSNASQITFTASGVKTDSYAIPANLQITHAASIKKASQATPSAPKIDKITDKSITVISSKKMEYSLDATTWQSSNIFNDLLPNHEYSIYQRVPGDSNHVVSEISPAIKVTTLKRSISNANITLNTAVFTYDGKPHVPEITVSVEGTVLDKGQYTVSYSNETGGISNNIDAGRIIATISTNSTGDYSGAAKIFYTINKADPHIGLVSIKTEVFTSTAVADSLLTRSDDSVPGKLEFVDVSSFEEGNNTYKYKFIPDNSNYNTIEGTVSCNVIKDVIKELTITGELKKSDYIYGEKPSLEGITVTAEYESGRTRNVTLLVEYDDDIMAGQTSLKLTYNGISAEIPITVAKANPVVTVPDKCQALYGTILSDIVLPSGWSWVNPLQTLEVVGERSYSAVFTPEDTENYNSITTDIIVKTTLEAPETTTGNKAIYGQKLSDITLPRGWEWKDPSLKVGNAGEKNSFTVVFGIDGLEEVVTLDVQPAELSVANIIVCNKEYDGDKSASIESISFDGFVNGDTIVPYEYTAEFDSASAGDDKPVIVKISLKSSNYVLSSPTSIAKASILQATPEVSIPSEISASLGNTEFLYDIDLGEGWSWDDAYTPISEPGTYTFYATYTPQDSNYAPVKTAVTVIISECAHGNVTEKKELASCTQDGYIEKICDDCGEVIYREEIKASHNWGDTIVITAPSCTTDGLSGIKCTDCGSIKPGSQQVIPSEGHHGGTTTCQHGAVCDECGVEYTLPVEHLWEDEFSKSEKYHWHECSVCGEKTDKEKHSFKNNKCIECGYKRTVVEEAEAKVEETVQHIFWDISVGAGLIDDGETLEYFEHDDYIIDDVIKSALAVACALIAIGVARKKKSRQH